LKLNDTIEKENLIIARQIIEQAKAMERIHIIYAYDDGANERHNDPVTGEDYYNETYGGDK
jgi:hypothetical protein